MGLLGPAVVTAVAVGAAAAVTHLDRQVIAKRTGAREGTGDIGGEGFVARFARLRWLHAVMAAACGLAGWSLAGSLGALAGVVGGVVLPPALDRRAAAKERVALRGQLADAVASIAGGLRAGRSLSSAIELTASESTPPLRERLQAIVDQGAVGVSLDDSLGAWSQRDRDDDTRLIVAVLRLHHRSGGDLAAVLDGLAHTLRERSAAASEVMALTAQARLSGTVVGLLPVGFLGFLAVTSPRDLAAAYRTPLGFWAIVIGLALDAGAYLWIRAMLRVEA